MSVFGSFDVAVAWALVTTAVLFFFWRRGYNSGVRHTEERWSEAVKRADANRKERA